MILPWIAVPLLAAIVWVMAVRPSQAQVYEKVFSFTAANAAAAGSGTNGGLYPVAPVIQASDGNFYGTTERGGENVNGTIFKLTAAGVSTTLYNFSPPSVATGETGTNSDGAIPTSGLIQGNDGNFYGTTSTGGANGEGTVFKITAAGLLSTLVTFTGTNGTDPGAASYAGLVQGTDGNFYGTTSAGGTNNHGTTFRMTPAGSLTTLVNFSGTNGSTPYAGLCQGVDGNFYGTTGTGGAKGYGTVFKMTPAGALSVLVSFSGTNGAAPHAGLVQDSVGNFYGTTGTGGAGSGGTVFQITPAGAFINMVQFSGTNGANPYGGLVQGSDGNFYGTTGSGGAGGGGTVFQMTPAGQLTTLVSFTGSNGLLPQAGLIQGNDGNFYGTTNKGGVGAAFQQSPNGGGTVFRMTPAGALTTLVLFTGYGVNAYGNNPQGGLVLGRDGNFYGATNGGGAYSDGTIFQMTPAGIVTKLLDFDLANGAQPVGLALGPDGNLYGATLAGGANAEGTVFQFSIAGTLTTLVSFSGTNGAFPAANLVTGTDGNLYGTTFYGGMTYSGTNVNQGQTGYGTVYEATTSGSLTTLSEFDETDGNQPASTLLEGTNGYFYGTATYTNGYGPGSVFQVTTTGSLTTLAPLNSSTGYQPGAGLITGTDGNFYGVGYLGGTSGDGTVFKVTPAGAVTAVLSFSGTDGANPSANLILGKDGNFYGTTQKGGAGGGGTVFKMTPTGALTMIYDFSNDPYDAGPLTPLIYGSDGNLYGETQGGTGNSGSGSIYRLIFPGPPNVYPLPAAVEGTTSALVSAGVNARGAITSASVASGTDGVNFPNTVQVASALEGFQTTQVGTILTNLSPGTVYYYYFEATSGSGTTVSPVQTFATLEAPSAAAAPAIILSPTSAQLNGIVNAEYSPTVIEFQYCTDGNFFPDTTNTAAATPSLVTGNTNTLVSGTITSLIPGVTYYYRIQATNEGGTSISGVSSFTAPLQPTVTLGAAMPISDSSIEVSGTVNAMGSPTQIVFQTGTDGVNFQNIASTPSTAAGTTGTPVTAVLTGLSQGNTYYYQIQATSIGGTTTSTTASYYFDLLSQFNQVLPVAPDTQGSLLVNLTPSVGTGWRFFGEQGEWRAPGVAADGLVPGGEYTIEFEPLPGYLQPSPESVQIASGTGTTTFSAEYYPTKATSTGEIEVTIEPQSVTTGTPPGQWRVVGAATWLASGAIDSNLSPGNYLVEFEPVPGYTTPATQLVVVTGNSISDATGIYSEAGVQPGISPQPVPYSSIISGTGLPYAYVGQVRGDTVQGTGFVVLPNVVATAGHVVFDGTNFTYTAGLQWLAQREAGVYEPVPQIPAGAMVLGGYSAALMSGVNPPGQENSATEDVDVGVMYFFSDATGTNGGYSGYLVSDEASSQYLTSSSSALMTLVGYPLDGIGDVQVGVPGGQGQMYATQPAYLTFNQPALGTDGTTGQPYQLYTTTGITAPGGVSGGPLCVQFQGGTYYPAAIYLGGNAETVVRAIDSNVNTLFLQAQTAGATHGTGGILPPPTPPSGGLSAGATILVTLNPPDAVLAGAEWSIDGGMTYNSSGGTITNLTPGTVTVTFSSLSNYGYSTPASQQVTLSGNQTTPVEVTYIKIPPPSINSTLTATGTEGAAFATYQITATNNPTAFTATGLPAGLGLSDTTQGIIAGTPGQSGSIAATIQAINASGTDTKTLTFYIAPEITSSEITSATEGQPFSYQITTGSDDVITSFGFSGILPNGLTPNPALGILSGTAQVPGLFNLTMSAIGAGGVNTEPLTLLVNAPGVAGVVLSVSADGAGTVTNLITSQTLQLPAQLVGISGSIYEFQAIADTGSFFGGWTGDIVSDANPLGGTITGNLSIEAVFSTYASAKGSYAGLIGTTPATIGQAGSVQLTLNAKGGYTGKMLYGGVTYTLKGAFDQTGSSTPAVKHGAAVGPAVQLHLETVTGSPQITGSVPGASDATLLAKKAAFTKAQPFDKAGRYTALIQSGTDSGSPQGIGYGALTVSALGNISFAGVLNDGTKVSVASTISADQTWPFYASPYKSTKFNDSSLKSGGFISGWVTFLEQTGTSDFSGTLDWGKTQTSSPKAIYPSGFQTQTALIGSLYELKHGASILDFPDTANNALLTFGFTPSLSGTISISPRNTLVLPVQDKLTLKFDLSDGLFSGHITEDGSLSSYSGAVFQTGTYGGGLILSGTASDPVTLSPSP